MSKWLSLLLASCGVLPLKTATLPQPIKPWREPAQLIDGGNAESVCYQQLTDILLLLDDSECNLTLAQFQTMQRATMSYIAAHNTAAYRYAIVNVPGCEWPNGDDAGFEVLQDFEDAQQSYLSVSQECVPSYCYSVPIGVVAQEAQDGGVANWELGAGRRIVLVEPGTEIQVSLSCM
jgi:hypothetical protein